MKILNFAAFAAALILTFMPYADADAATKRKKRARRKAGTEQPAPEKTVCPENTAPATADSIQAAGDTLRIVRPAKDTDVLLADWYERNIRDSYDEYFDRFITLETAEKRAALLPDSIYARRLRELVSPVQLPYNPIIKNYIVVYTEGEKSKIGRILGLAQHYFPMIEDELLREEMPVELRMLPVIESALSPVAVSRAGAVGLWQFMPSTGKSYGLEVNSLIDERRDPVASTRAACRFLKELYGMFGDWSLALAAYNCGPGNVNKAIARAGGKCRTFWDIYDYLPRETRGYVPAFIAATYAYHYHRYHGVTIEPAPLPLATDTVHVNRIMHLGQVASTIECPLDTLRALNPQYCMDIVPAAQRSYPLTLPQTFVTQYIEHEQEIMAKDSTYLKEYINPANLDKKRHESSATTYRVKRGDTLGAIARKHGVSIQSIMRSNNLKSANRIREGQVLRIERRR